MTDATNTSDMRSAVPTLSKAELTTLVVTAIDKLQIALAAAKLVLDMANDSSLRAKRPQPTQGQGLEHWRATALLMYEVFDNLHHDGYYALEAVKLLLDLD